MCRAMNAMLFLLAYLLGIECDGATYHSSKSARDRDRIRQAVLEGLGWNIYRVWSTDWFKNPSRELKKLVDELKKLVDYLKDLEEDVDKEKEKPVTIEPTISYETIAAAPVFYETIAKTADWIMPYRETKNVSLVGKDLPNENDDVLIEAIAKYIKAEAPIHKAHLKTIFTQKIGIQKIGSRIDAKLDYVFKLGEHYTEWRIQGEFLWLNNQLLDKARDRSDLDEKLRRIDWIVPREIQIALRCIVKDAIKIEKTELMRETLKILIGSTRLTAGIQKVIEKELDFLLKNKSLINEDSFISLN